MEVKQSVLDSKIAGVEKKFEELAKQQQVESQKISASQQNLNAITEEMVRLQGEHRAFIALKDNGQAKPELKIPKKKTAKED